MAISLEPDGNDFILRQSKESGGSAEIVLSQQEVMDFAQSALSYRQHIMSRRHEGAVYATPVSDARALWDALGENILLEMRFQSSGNVIFEVPPDHSRELAYQILTRLEESPTSLTRQ